MQSPLIMNEKINKNVSKKMEIKFSRFIKKINDEMTRMEVKHPEIVFQKKLSDHDIENIYNKYVSLQKGDFSRIEFVSGKDILNGYHSENYISGNSTLHKSCMTDKFEALKLYIENPDQVKLAIMWIDDKVAARAFVWKTVDGEVYHDRIYYGQDWMGELMNTHLKSSGIKGLPYDSNKIVKLDNWKFKYNPYVDSFYHLDGANGNLYYISTNFYEYFSSLYQTENVDQTLREINYKCLRGVEQEIDW